MTNTYNCISCQREINPERIDALKFLGKTPNQFECVVCASQHDKKIQATYLGASGISPMIFCDNVRNTPPQWDRAGYEIEPTILEDEDDNSVQN